MIPLIDADIIVYTIAFVTENFNEEADVAKRVNKYVLQILANTDCDGRYLMFLTGKENYRKSIYPDYKKSRRNTPKPRWYEFVRQHLQDKWNAIVVNNIEADDALSITQNYYKNNTQEITIVCSKDKDLLQIPGMHYRIPTNYTLPYKILDISEEEAFLMLMQQSIMGDRVDDIPGIRGIGPAKSEKIMKDVPMHKLFDVIIRKYIDVDGAAGPSTFWLNYELVKLLEVEDKGFTIPEFSKISLDVIQKYKDKYE